MSQQNQPCQHKNINLKGNDETGLNGIRCDDCGCPMTRKVEAGEYVYEQATRFQSQSARDAEEMNYGKESYWQYLDQHAFELRDYFLRKGDPVQAKEMMTRSLSDSLKGNDGI